MLILGVIGLDGVPPHPDCPPSAAAVCTNSLHDAGHPVVQARSPQRRCEPRQQVRTGARGSPSPWHVPQLPTGVRTALFAAN